jgi:3-oxoacyl-[acyl-carrier-protein] synthase-1
MPLALTHYTLTTCLGAGVAANLAALQAGKSGLTRCDFETVDLPTCIGTVPGLDDFALPEKEFDCRNNRLAAKTLAEDGFAEAIADAISRYGAGRIGLFLGTSTAGILATEQAYRQLSPAGDLPQDFPYAGTQNTYSVAAYVRQKLGLAGPAFVVSTACASTGKAFGNAARWIEAGLCDAAIVGGVDTLCLTTLYGFHSLVLTAEQPCRPFSATRTGISIGEAGGFALLERSETGVQLLGVGESSDAWHMSSPHPEGVGAKLAMEAALAEAALEPAAIDYINLHGTATLVGDAAEDRAITSLFGTATPCSSTKGYTGHTLGAAGIVEAIIAALCLEHDFMPGSVPTSDLDPALRAQHLISAKPGKLRHVMSNSFGFGGSNCSLILARAA